MYRALIVDDEPLMLEGMRLMVDWQRHGFAMPQEADSGRQALELIRCEKPDLVITDLNMPGLGGVELSELCRKEFPDMLVAYFSGYQDFHYAQSAIRVGALGYLLKPIEPEQVHELLDAAQVELNRRCAPRRDAAPAEDTPEPVRYALEAIAERFAQTLSLRDLAQEQGLTCAYLGQLISRSTGKGFARLLLEKRMHAARQLLMDDVSVGETARRCGIGDVSYFSQLYRRFFGENPSHHRRGQKRGAAPC